MDSKIQGSKEALGKTKNQKATGEEGLNTELFKYGHNLLKLQLLHLYIIFVIKVIKSLAKLLK